MKEDMQICFMADESLSQAIEDRRGDVARAVFVRKTLKRALGLEEERKTSEKVAEIEAK
jgi:hypothetical protein